MNKQLLYLCKKILKPMVWLLVLKSSDKGLRLETLNLQYTNVKNIDWELYVKKLKLQEKGLRSWPSLQ